jgi:hypothetical protein
MKRIISHCSKRDDNTCKLQEIAECEKISMDQLKKICTSDEYRHLFQISDQILSYFPPFGIKNKKTLRYALENFFPSGLRFSHIQYCYEFIESDLNELKYENKVFIMKYGKTLENIYFWNIPYQSSSDCDIKDIWSSTNNFKITRIL